MKRVAPEKARGIGQLKGSSVPWILKKAVTMRAFFKFALHLTFILNIASAQQPSAPPAADQKSARDTQIQDRDQLWLQAQTLQSEGKKKEAIAVGERGLAIKRKAYGDSHEKLTGTIEWLSQQYLAQQNLPHAEKCEVELLRVPEALHGKMGWQAVSARWWLDYVRKVSIVQPATLIRMLASEAEVNRLLAEGKLADAAAEIEKLILLEESTLGSDHPFFANTFAIQADCLLKAEQFAAAETSAERALSIRRKQLGDQHPDTALVAFLLARSQMRQNHGGQKSCGGRQHDLPKRTGRLPIRGWQWSMFVCLHHLLMNSSAS